MKEVLSSPNTKRFLRAGSALAAVALVVGGAKYGQEIATRLKTSESKIVEGVPGQVETHLTQDRVVLVNKPWAEAPVYWLGVEQCPADIVAAKEGRTTVSYDPVVKEVYDTCNYDLVRVDKETWKNVQDGQEITFGGDIGEPLRK